MNDIVIGCNADNCFTVNVHVEIYMTPLLSQNQRISKLNSTFLFIERDQLRHHFVMEWHYIVRRDMHFESEVKFIFTS